MLSTSMAHSGVASGSRLRLSNLTRRTVPPPGIRSRLQSARQPAGTAAAAPNTADSPGWPFPVSGPPFDDAAHERFEAWVKRSSVKAHQLASAEDIRRSIQRAAQQVLPDLPLHVVTWGSASDGTAVLGISDADYVVVNQPNQPLTRQQRKSLVEGVKRELEQAGLGVEAVNKSTATTFVLRSGKSGQKPEFPESFDVVVKHVLYKQGKKVELEDVELPGKNSTKWAVRGLKLLLHGSEASPSLASYALKAIVCIAYYDIAAVAGAQGPRALDVFAKVLSLLHSVSCVDLNKGIQDRVPFNTAEAEEMEVSDGDLEALRNITKGLCRPSA
jgi:hypothetical protein